MKALVSQSVSKKFSSIKKSLGGKVRPDLKIFWVHARTIFMPMCHKVNIKDDILGQKPLTSSTAEMYDTVDYALNNYTIVCYISMAHKT